MERAGDVDKVSTRRDSTRVERRDGNTDTVSKDLDVSDDLKCPAISLHMQVFRCLHDRADSASRRISPHCAIRPPPSRFPPSFSRPIRAAMPTITKTTYVA